MSTIRRYFQLLRRHPLPVWAGLTVVGALQLRRVLRRGEDDDDGEDHHKNDLLVSGYKALPLRTLSRWWGRLNDVTLPVWSRPLVLGCYAKLFHCNLEECAESDLRKFRNLGEFFRRRLKDGCRPIDETRRGLVSPCDGRVFHFGQVMPDGRLDPMIKGVSYPLQEFLGVVPEIRQGSRLYCCAIYLAPGDYHGFHSPTQWQVRRRTHFEGELLSVSPFVLRRFPKVFSINERVVYTGTWEQGFLSMTAIGATNVGSVVVPMDPELKTNCKGPESKPKTSTFQELPPLGKGQYFGEFNLGSTIVLLFEAADSVTFHTKVGQPVKLGQCIAELALDNVKRSKA